MLLWLGAGAAIAAADARSVLELEYRGYRSAIERSAFAEARPHATRALEAGRSLYGAEHETTALLELNLGDLELQLQRLDAAEPLYMHALSTLEKLKGQRDLALLVPLNDLAEIHSRGLRFAEAVRYQRRALGVIEAAYGADHPATAHRLIALGILAESAGDESGARASYERALQIRRKLFAGDHPDVAEGLYLLGRLELRGGRYDRAQALYREALGIWQKAAPADRRALGAAQSQLALTEQRLAPARREVPEPRGDVAAEPIERSAPEYPESAMTKGIEGWVRVSFTVNAKGQVKNARVVEAEPGRLFNRAALAALATWTYRPRVVAGRPVDQPGTEVVIRFVVPEDMKTP